MAISKAKYRPSLPAHLIAHITALAKSETPLSTESIELIGILAPFQAKIENLALTPAYTTNPKPSTFELLGGEVVDAGETKEAYWYRCYLKLKNNPEEGLTLQEMQAADEHRYLNDLMTDEEIRLFECDTVLCQKQAE